MAKMFQVKLSGEWQNYSKDEDKMLKRAFLAGFPHARYSLRGQKYEVNFEEMSQKNVRSGKSRQIRQPHRWQAPREPISQAGPSMVIQVPAGSPGHTIHVAHPKSKDQFIAVKVPARAKTGQALLVPVPPLEAAAVKEVSAKSEAPAAVPATPAAPASPAAAADSEPAEEEKTAKKGMGAVGKVCLGAGGLAAVGGVAVAGAILGEHIAEEGWDATMAEIGEAFEDAGEAIVDGFEDAGEWIVDAAEDAGEWVMDLF